MQEVEHESGAETVSDYLFNVPLFWDVHLIHQLRLLVASSKLKELLNHVVAKHVRHQAVRRGQDLLEDQLLLLGRGSLQLLLDES